jgi:hypothetical protein
MERRWKQGWHGMSHRSNRLPCHKDDNVVFDSLLPRKIPCSSHRSIAAQRNQSLWLL